MRQNKGGAERLPFHSAAGPFPTKPFEEAAARLLFVAEQHWPAGWLFGPSGTGKSALLRLVQRELRRSGAETVFLSACGLDGDEFWTALATLLGGREPESRLAARKTVRALLAAASMINRPVTLLIDDVDRGGDGLAGEVPLLIRIAEGVVPSHTVIVATAGKLPDSELARRIDLRADLPPFTREETAGYVAWRLEAAQSANSFAEEAIDELFAVTGGIPAAIGRVADLALIAANAAESTTVTAEFVRTASEELRPADDRPLISLTAAPARRSA